jgi:putative transposase
MSRVATPTDNPIIEAVNGWVKWELYSDWNIHKQIHLRDSISTYIRYFNHERPEHHIQYKYSIQYKFDQGFI